MIPQSRTISAALAIQRADGSWQDLSQYLNTAEVELGDVSSVGTGDAGVDGRVRTLRFKLQHAGDSFSPRDKTSAWNFLGGDYSPLLWPNRRVRLDAIVDGVQTRLFEGYLGDSITADGSCECRDLAKQLQDCYIETKRIYGSGDGTPAETVIQQILDDNLGAGAVTLYCPVPPGFMVTAYELDYMSVWDAIQQVTQQIGWFLGYRPDGSEFKLTLMEPPRGKTVADFTLDYQGDIYVQDLEIGDADVRNVVTVTYRDAATKRRESVTLGDPDSIATFGRRAMAIEEADTSLIDTSEEAERFARAALDDLFDLPVVSQIDMPLLPQMDVFAGLAIRNPRVSSTTDFYAAQSVRHTLDFAGGKLRTEIVAGGKVIGGKARWLRMETRPGAKEPLTMGDIAPIERVEPQEIVVQQADGSTIQMTQFGLVTTDANNPEIERVYVNRLAMGEGSDGDFVQLDWDQAPKVLLSERRLVTYNHAYSGKNQRVEVYADDVGPDGFKIHCQSWVADGTILTHTLGQDGSSSGARIGPSSPAQVGYYWTSPATTSTTVTRIRLHGWGVHAVLVFPNNVNYARCYYQIYYKLAALPDTEENWTFATEFNTYTTHRNGDLFNQAYIRRYPTWTQTIMLPAAGQYQVKVRISNIWYNWNGDGSGAIEWTQITWWEETAEAISAVGDAAWIAIEGGADSA